MKMEAEQQYMSRKRKPILGRAWELIVSPMGKVIRKPNFIAFCRNSSRSSSKYRLPFRKSSKLLRHHNYYYVGEHEYDFSPSTTPLFGKSKSKSRFKKRPGCGLLCLLCGASAGGRAIMGNSEDEEFGWGGGSLGINIVPVEDVVVEEEQAGGLEWSEEKDEEEEEEEESVDQRAEEFIERFYEEMRIQRQLSLVKYMEMLNRGC